MTDSLPYTTPSTSSSCTSLSALPIGTTGLNKPLATAPVGSLVRGIDSASTSVSCVSVGQSHYNNKPVATSGGQSLEYSFVSASELPKSSSSGTVVDLSRHVARGALISSALLDSALRSKTEDEMSGVDTLATVAAALDPRESQPPPPYSASLSMDSVDSATSLPFIAKSGDGYVMKLVDSRSLKLVNQGSPVYVNVKDKMIKSPMNDYQVVKTYGQTVKPVYQSKSPAVVRSPAAPRPPGSSPAPPRPSASSSSPRQDEASINFQVVKTGDKHGRRPVSEPPRYITQLTQNIQQQQQQQHNSTGSVLHNNPPEDAYVMRSLPTQAVHAVRISDASHLASVLPSGYTAQTVLPVRGMEYRVVAPDDVKSATTRVKSEFPDVKVTHINSTRPEYIMRSVSDSQSHGHESRVSSHQTPVRAVDIQAVKMVDTLARGYHSQHVTAGYVASARAPSSTTPASDHYSKLVPSSHPRSVSVDGSRPSTAEPTPETRPNYHRLLSVDTALACQHHQQQHQQQQLPSSDYQDKSKRPLPVRSAGPPSTPLSGPHEDKLIDNELKLLVNDADKTHWGVVIFNGWLTSKEMNVSPTQLDSVNLAALLTLYYSDLKSELTPEHLNLSSLMDMRDALDQYFRARGHPCSIVTDIRFGLANQAFDSVIAACDAHAKLHSLGMTRTPCLSEKRSPEQPLHNPRDLLTRVWCDLKTHLRGFNVDQLRQMKKTDFLITSCEDGRLVVNHVVRNWQDIIKTPTKSGTEYKCIPFMYQNKDNPAVCPVQTFLEYSTRLCPSGVEFFQHPLTNYKYAGRIWYSCDKSTKCLLHHRDDLRSTPPSSGRSTPSASASVASIPKNKRRSSAGKSVQPMPQSPVHSPRPTSTFSDSAQSDVNDRQRTRSIDDGSFSPLPDISSILKQPPPLSQIHDNMYTTPVSTPASVDTPTPTPTGSKSKSKKKKPVKKPKPVEKPVEQAPSDSQSDVQQESHLDDILAEVVEKNKRDDADMDRMCTEAMTDHRKTVDPNSLETEEPCERVNQQQMAELAMRSLEMAAASATTSSGGVTETEADRMIGHVVAGLENVDRHQQAGLDMIIDYVVSNGEYNELIQYLTDDQQHKPLSTKPRRPRNHDLTSNGSSEVMSDIDSVIDQVILAPGYDELAAPLEASATDWHIPEKRKTPDPEQALPPKKRKKANNMKMSEFQAPSTPMHLLGHGSPNPRTPTTPRTPSTPVERKYTSMEEIDTLINDVIAKSIDWTEPMDFDDDEMDFNGHPDYILDAQSSVDALEESLPDMPTLSPNKVDSGYRMPVSTDSGGFTAYRGYPSAATSGGFPQRLPPVGTVMPSSPLPTRSNNSTPFAPSTPTDTMYPPNSVTENKSSTPGTAVTTVAYPAPSIPSQYSANRHDSPDMSIGGPRQRNDRVGSIRGPPPPYSTAISKRAKEVSEIPSSDGLAAETSSTMIDGLRDKVSSSSSSQPPLIVTPSNDSSLPLVSQKSDTLLSSSPDTGNKASSSDPVSSNASPTGLVPMSEPGDVSQPTVELNHVSDRSKNDDVSSSSPNDQSERKLRLRSADRKSGTPDSERKVVDPAKKRITPDRKSRETSKPVDAKSVEKSPEKEKIELVDKRRSESPPTERRETRSSTRSSERNRKLSESSDGKPRTRKISGSTASREVSPDVSMPDRVTRSTRSSSKQTTPNMAATVAGKSGNETTPPPAVNITNTRSRRSLVNNNSASSINSASSTSNSTSTSSSSVKNSNNNINKLTNNDSSGRSTSSNYSKSVNSVSGSSSGSKEVVASDGSGEDGIGGSSNSGSSGGGGSGDQPEIRTTRSTTASLKSEESQQKVMQLREKSARFTKLMQRIVSDETSSSS